MTANTYHSNLSIDIDRSTRWEYNGQYYPTIEKALDALKPTKMEVEIKHSVTNVSSLEMSKEFERVLQFRNSGTTKAIVTISFQ